VGFVVGQSGAGQVFSKYFGFPLQSSFAPPITPQSPSYIIRGKMYNRPMCGRSTGTYKNLGDLQRDLRGLSPTPANKKKNSLHVLKLLTMTLVNVENKL
jgi:hypothetical protein